MPFHLASWSATFRARVDRVLDAELDAGAVGSAPLAQAMRYAVLAPRAKRLRGLLSFAAAQAAGSPGEEAEPAACAVELLHAATLVHDDLPALDGDLWRRGRPSLHARFGEALALLAGDALIVRAFEVLSRGSPMPAVHAVRALAEACGPLGMAGGVGAEVLATGRRLSAAQLDAIHVAKTAALIRAALRMGGLFAGASGPVLATLDAYGLALGRAFQLADDLANALGDRAEIGKPTGTDLAAGRPSAVALLGEEGTRAELARQLEIAFESVAPLGPRGAPLIGLARQVPPHLAKPADTRTAAHGA